MEFPFLQRRWSSLSLGSRNAHEDSRRGPVPASETGHLDPNWAWYFIWNTNPAESEKGAEQQEWQWDEVMLGDALEAKLRGIADFGRSCSHRSVGRDQ